MSAENERLDTTLCIEKRDYTVPPTLTNFIVSKEEVIE